MSTNVFAIISDAGLLKAGVMHETKVSTLKANGFEHTYHGEDFLNALANCEYAIFLPESAEDIESLYDETNMFSLSYNTVELLLNRYRQQ